jgi:inner membrane protein
LGFEKFNRNSISIRIFIIAILVLIMMVPSAMITTLVSERENRKNEAIHEIASKWAYSQTVGGPVITLPYEETIINEEGKPQTVTGYIQLLPDLLEITGNLNPEIRYRGIYKAILYNTKIYLNGYFSFEKLNSFNINPQQIKWSDAFIAVSISDMRGIKDVIELNWDSHKLLLEPGIKVGNNIFNSGVSLNLPLPDTGPGDKQKTFPFSLQLNLNGSEDLNFLPMGRKTLVQLTSSWTDPSFSGAFLPESRKITKNAFTAKWRILDLNRNYPQQWVGDINKDDITVSSFGVKLFSPVTEYTKTTRAVKYLFMFVGLTFLVFFLVEVFNKKRIHPIQYILIGLSLCIFYVLLLSLSEHIHFEWAYLISGLCITALIGFYVKNALGNFSLTLITTILLIIMYGFMYVLLQNQDYALLLGSIGIFIIMAVVMYLSRNLDWYKIELNN